jgi:hypothetical protein
VERKKRRQETPLKVNGVGIAEKSRNNSVIEALDGGA